VIMAISTAASGIRASGQIIHGSNALTAALIGTAPRAANTPADSSVAAASSEPGTRP
jgi:hypothetical protein